MTVAPTGHLCYFSVWFGPRQFTVYIYMTEVLSGQTAQALTKCTQSG